MIVIELSVFTGILQVAAEFHEDVWLARTFEIVTH